MTERSDSELHELADELFAAGRAEVVPPEARARALEAVGLDGPPVPPATSSGAGALKWGLTAVGVAGVGGLLLLSQPDVAPPPAPRAAEVASAPAREGAPSPALPSPASAPEPSENAPQASPSASMAAAPPEAPASAEKRAAPARSNGATDRLAAELAALDRARSTLRGGDPNQALRLLGEYDKSFPRGSLKSEALMLRVEALTRAGRRDEALRLAEPIIAANPDGLAAKRLKGLLQ